MRFVLTLLLGLMVWPLLAADLEDEKEDRQEADLLFSQERYAQALPLYLNHAEDGDKFAQYRLALMYYFGLGVATDKVEAAAWAGVAQENRLAVLRKLYVLIEGELETEQLAQLKTRLAALDRQYGTTVMEKPERVYKRGRSCTGSRVGRACDRVNSFGVISQDQGNYYETPQVAYTMTPEEVEAFKTRYSTMILKEFATFDKVRSES